jgi:hypothetical protein
MRSDRGPDNTWANLSGSDQHADSSRDSDEERDDRLMESFRCNAYARKQALTTMEHVGTRPYRGASPTIQRCNRVGSGLPALHSSDSTRQNTRWSVHSFCVAASCACPGAWLPSRRNRRDDVVVFESGSFGRCLSKLGSRRLVMMRG